ncbi:MAG: NAD(P)H-hydrate dehydratase [Candidatus Omnitrophica bacterium]|nr:NAD(P)H-hydrate dehydratase [Candidatus Omnitrophota bacterium]MDD5352560.1 NAD(P)H-hydrate dehydratase [Candidatus Omnitrophota bacterium]MDD5550158.1 NAD(P)H-hydrate dehydratase [Candidatus Omnitrophota bacterium]
MQLPQQLYKRKEDSHKNDFGHVFILAGSLGMTGAAILAAKSALRCGAGLVTLGLPESLVRAVASHTVEVMMLPLAETSDGTLSKTAFDKIKEFLEKSDVLLIGPGLSQNIQTQELIRKTIFESRVKTLIDADAINAWAGFLDKFKVGISCLPLDKTDFRIITPHPGEMARLLDVSPKNIQNKKREVARNFAKEYNLVVVLKGYQTVVADPAGSIYVNKTGNSGMSTAGCGDVLSGIIAALLAQGLNSFDAAKYGVYLHGLAGDLAAQEKTQLALIASDIIDCIPAAIKKSIK